MIKLCDLSLHITISTIRSIIDQLVNVEPVPYESFVNWQSNLKTKVVLPRKAG